MTDDLLVVDNLEVHFPVKRQLFRKARGPIKAVDGVSFSIAPGETLGLVGESGCGKSTLLRAVMRLIEPTAGNVRFAGEEITKSSRRQMQDVRKQMQIVFQDPFGSLNPRMTVGENVIDPLLIHKVMSRPEAEKFCGDLLESVGLARKDVSRFPHQFSGGQRQRIAIARAICLRPRLVVCDEPVSALDVSVQAQVLNLLADLRRDLGLTYLFVAHDLAVVRHFSDRVAVMYLGRIVEIGKVEEIYDRPAHPYTKALLSAVPIPDPEIEAKRERILLPGDVGSAGNIPKGCRFRSRCWKYGAMGQPKACEDIDPALAPVGVEQSAACHFPITETAAGGEGTEVPS